MALKRKISITLFVACAVVAAVLLTGCGASVTVYDYTESGVRYNSYEIAVDSDTLAEMEKTAAVDGNGNKYTVAEYLYSLFTGFGYELESASVADGKYTVSYRKAVDGEPELYRLGTPVKFDSVSTATPFIRTYYAESPNPFNGIREYYDGIGPERSATMLERVKNGVKAQNEYGEPVVIYPSITEAFPYTIGANMDGLLLNYVQMRSDRMGSSGTTERVGSRTVNYTFSRYFDRTDSIIAYEYRRAVPYGWYVMAVAAGAVTFVIFRAATKKKTLLR